MKIGFLVNPIAGLGGRVGLKGTDGMVDEALSRGATPVAGDRALECLKVLKAGKGKFSILTCSLGMGAELLEGFDYEVVLEVGEDTTGDDTRKACARFMDNKVDLILFCGGDGTARDVYSQTKDKVPVLGIPAGVKMHSACFAVNPQAAGELVLEYVGGEAGLHEAEVMDVDEKAYRNNELKTRLFGYLKTPYRRELVQAGKRIFMSGDDEQAKSEIAEFSREFMSDGSAYILGAGSTTKAIADRLGVDKTLLGVDVVKNNVVLVKDANEKDLLRLLEREPKVKVIVSPIGAQGFVFGRGTQQISPQVLGGVGVKNIIYVATSSKLNSIPYLLVDTGDADLDRQLSGYMSVVIGYRLSQKKDIKAVAQVD